MAARKAAAVAALSGGALVGLYAFSELREHQDKQVRLYDEECPQITDELRQVVSQKQTHSKSEFMVLVQH